MTYLYYELYKERILVVEAEVTKIIINSMAVHLPQRAITKITIILISDPVSREALLVILTEEAADLIQFIKPVFLLQRSDVKYEHKGEVIRDL